MNRHHGGLIRVFSHEQIDPERPDHKEPCMNICRRSSSGHGTRVVIPLMNLHEYWGTEAFAAKVVEFTQVLFGNPFSRSDLLIVGNFIDDGLEELFKQKPHLGLTAGQLDNEMDRLGIKLTVDGETILDAT